MDTLTVQEPWWKTSTVYQIYPRSFQDSNGDGVGDLPGITRRVPYLAALGVDVLWLSPVYQSPMKDNGYDIANYDAIDPLFGTRDDFAELVSSLHSHGIRLVMDLVVNHTSDQHPWFQESRNPDSPRHDWYIWRDPRRGAAVDTYAQAGQWRGDEPNRWVSAFSGPIWTWDDIAQQYYLHFFTPEQPDLNWENTDLRAEIYAMMRRWLDQGVDGFRMDVISLISKPTDLYDDGDGSLDSAIFGPRFHEYLQEMHREVFDAYPDRIFFTVGETPGATPEQAVMMTDPSRRELDMVFQFEHMVLDSIDGDKFHVQKLFLPDMKSNLARWTTSVGNRGWNSLYLSNHDQPRPVSRYGDDVNYRYESATAWGAMLHAHQGTPFVYQGEELGMGNYPWTDICEFDDVETRNYWRDRVELGGEDPARVWPGVAMMSRDNARTPMQWDNSSNAGFSRGVPWLPVHPNYRTLNAQSQVGVEGSIFEFYRKMIALRKRHPVLVHGDFTLHEGEQPTLWWIERKLGDTTLHALANMSADPVTVAIPNGQIILRNIPSSPRDNAENEYLAPWEVRWILTTPITAGE